MERIETRVEGVRLNGTKIIRKYFINDTINYLGRAQSHFTKKQVKKAKLKYGKSKVRG